MEDTMVSLCLNLKDQRNPPSVRARKGDTARVLELHVAEGESPYELDPRGFAVLTGRKPDRTVLYQSCEIRDNAVYYPFTEQTTACPGLTQLQLRLYGGDNQLLSTARFYLEVSDTVYEAGDASKSKDDQTALNELVNRTLTLKNHLEDLEKQGAFNGRSAYEEAVALGYTGTRQQWLDSLRYDHSPEFQVLALQVRQDADRAEGALIQGEARYSNALLSRFTGKEIRAKHVSPLSHRVKGRIFSRNLLPFPYENSTVTLSGVSFTVREDGTVLVDGRAEETVYFTLAFVRDLPEDFFREPMFLSGNPVSGNEGIQLRLWGMSKGYTYRDLGAGAAIPQGLQRYQPEAEFDICILKDTVVSQAEFRPMVHYGTEAGDYAAPRNLEGLPVTLGPEEKTVYADRFGLFTAPAQSPEMTCSTEDPELTLSLTCHRDVNGLLDDSSADAFTGWSGQKILREIARAKEEILAAVGKG